MLGVSMAEAVLPRPSGLVHHREVTFSGLLVNSPRRFKLKISSRRFDWQRINDLPTPIADFGTLMKLS